MMAAGLKDSSLLSLDSASVVAFEAQLRKSKQYLICRL